MSSPYFTDVGDNAWVDKFWFSRMLSKNASIAATWEAVTHFDALERSKIIPSAAAMKAVEA